MSNLKKSCLLKHLVSVLLLLSLNFNFSLLMSELFVSGEDKLPSALGSLCSSSNVCSTFAGLSGNTDEDLFPSSGELLHIRDDVRFSMTHFIPFK